MKPLDILKAKGKSVSLDQLLTNARIMKAYQSEIRIELANSTSQVNIKNLVEAQIGRTIDTVSSDIRIYVPAGVIINPYAHTGNTGVDAITLEGIPSDKSIILENHGTIIGSAGLGGEGTYGGSNQTRYGSVAHGGSCVKMVNLAKFILINEGLMYGGKGVGANGSGGVGGNGTAGTSSWYYGSTYGTVTSAGGAGGNGGEWDGYGFSSWTMAVDRGLTLRTSYYKPDAGSYQQLGVIGAPSSVAGAGGSGTYDDTIHYNYTSNYAIYHAPRTGGNGGSQGGAGGKGNVAVGYGRGASGGAGGSSGGNGGTGGTMTVVVNGSDVTITGSNGVSGGAGGASAGNQGAYGNGGGALTNATVTEFTVVNNGTILSGKDLDANRGGYLL